LQASSEATMVYGSHCLQASSEATMVYGSHCLQASSGTRCRQSPQHGIKALTDRGAAQ
jgi:hypothetical protein